MNIVSFSGGKDSTAMLLMMVEKGIPVDEVLFCDTGVEHDELYSHIDKVESFTGIPITRLTPSHTFEYYLYEKPLSKGKNKGTYGYGWSNQLCRWCTRHLKTNVINRYLKKYSNDDIVQFVGIAADEPKRIKETSGWKRYPLFEWGVTEADALKYCYEHGFDFGGLYEHFDRLGCWLCPLMNMKELKSLYSFYPQKWEKLLEIESRFEANCTNPKAREKPFRKGYSVRDLDRKFRK